jgi:hypothetical protein
VLNVFLLLLKVHRVGVVVRCSLCCCSKLIVLLFEFIMLSLLIHFHCVIIAKNIIILNLRMKLKNGFILSTLNELRISCERTSGA